MSVTIYDDGRAGGTVDRTIEAIESLGGTLVQRYKSSVSPPKATAVFALPASALTPTAQLNDVIWLDYRLPRVILEDEMSAQIIAGQYNPLAPGYQAWLQGVGVTGAGVTVALIDTGFDNGRDDPNTHPDVGGRLIPIQAGNPPQDPVDTFGHGTMVGGIIAGDASNTDPATGNPVTDTSDFLLGLGVAPGVTMVVRNNDGPINLRDWQRDARINGAIISNNSYGYNPAGAAYSDFDVEADQLVRDAIDPGMDGVAEPLIIVFSAGNQGVAGPTKAAKNIIAVGATQNQRLDWFQPNPGDPVAGIGNINNMYVDPITGGRSSRGPAQDGRIYPHVVAPGQNIISTKSQQPGLLCCDTVPVGAPAGDPTYAIDSGTSLAAPHVTGGIALITEWWRGLNAGANPSPAMAKALLVNGADDVVGGTDIQGNVMGNIPNDDAGWGRVNLSNVLAAGVPMEYYDQPITLTQAYAEHAFCFDVANPAQDVKVTLTWTDAPGDPGSNVLVNDLDLTVVLTATGDIYFGGGGENAIGNPVNVFNNGFSVPNVGGHDRVDNLENVFIQTPGASGLRVTVEAASLDGDGVPYNDDDTDQDFALVVRNVDRIDSDCDGILDSVENSFGIENPDEDQFPNYLDLDSDGDTITDTVEAGPDPLNPLDTDSLITATTFVAADLIPDFLDLDSDNDTISDTIEDGDDDPATPPVDTDGDLVPDYRDFDSDDDTILDLHEALTNPDERTLIVTVNSVLSFSSMNSVIQKQEVIR